MNKLILIFIFIISITFLFAKDELKDKRATDPKYLLYKVEKENIQEGCKDLYDDYKYFYVSAIKAKAKKDVLEERLFKVSEGYKKRFIDCNVKSKVTYTTPMNSSRIISGSKAPEIQKRMYYKANPYNQQQK